MVKVIASHVRTLVDLLNITYALCISDLGPGWNPTFLNTREEFDFVKEAQIALGGSEDYTIGGSSSLNVDPLQVIESQNLLEYATQYHQYRDK